MNVSMDKNKNFPNQLVDGDFFECVALAVTDIVGNIDGRIYNNDFTYAATLFLEGITPGVDPDGSEPWTAFQSACVYGLLPQSVAPFTSKNKGELYAANFNNYIQQYRTIALEYTQKAPKNVGVDYFGVISDIKAIGYGVALPMTWYSSFMQPLGSLLPAPAGITSAHCPVAYVSDTGELVIKPWLGPSWGDGGYAVLTKQMFDTTVTDAYSFDPNGSRWRTILAVLITKYPYLIDYYSQLVASN